MGGYIEACHPQCAVRMCPTLKLSLANNEVEMIPDGTGARVLVAARTSSSGTIRPWLLRMKLKWRTGKLVAIFLCRGGSQQKAGVEVAISDVLRALFGKERQLVSSEDAQALCDVFAKTVKSRVPPTWQSDGLLRRASMEEPLRIISPGLDVVLNPPAAQNAAELAGLLAQGAAAASLDDALAFLGLREGEDQADVLCSRGPAPRAPQAQTEAALDGLDLLARLYCAALARSWISGPLPTLAARRCDSLCSTR